MKRRALLTVLAVTASSAAIGATAACGVDVNDAVGGPAKVRLGFSAWPGWLPWQVGHRRPAPGLPGRGVPRQHQTGAGKAAVGWAAGAEVRASGEVMGVATNSPHADSR
jgi:hypothetical protein